MSWEQQLKRYPIDWLLEPDAPEIRHMALRDLLEMPADDPQLRAAQTAAHHRGPIPAILDKMDPAGFWAKPGAGYLPKYFSTVWSLISLAQLGASADQDTRISAACTYLVDHALTDNGQFSMNGAPSATIDCLQGNLLGALLDLGYDDPRLDAAWEWMARTVTGEGIAPMEDRHAPLRYYAGKCGPNFACGANNKLPCAWGAVKVMLAFAKLPPAKRTPLIERAIQQGVDFLFSVDPASAGYPTGYSDKPSGNWWKFGFPVFYITDLLQNVEALARLGYGNDPRLAGALRIIREKQDAQGRWALEFNYSGKTWVEYGPPRQPNNYVTLRALRTLKMATRQQTGGS
jgi:hypothetical protein